VLHTLTSVQTTVRLLNNLFLSRISHFEVSNGLNGRHKHLPCASSPNLDVKDVITF